MKRINKILSCILAAAMAVPLLPSAAFSASEDEYARPSISNPVEAGENYADGIYAIDWGSTDWGAFKDVDWTDTDIMNAEELAARLKESGVNALAFEDALTYEDGVLSVGDTPLQEDDLGGITLEGNTIAFPKGDTALIIPIKNFGALEADSEAVLDIPDDSNVAVIAVAKDGVQPILNYTIWGHNSRDTFTVNTNKNGNLAVVNLVVSEYSAQGMLMNGELNINGTGTVAAVGGKSGSSSIGIYADSVNVNGASLIAAGDFSTTTSRGIDASKELAYSDERTGGITADNGALIIGVGGNALSCSVGIETMNISAKNGSEIYAYGGVVPGDDGDSDNDMRTIGLQIAEGVTKRTITADNGSKLYARAGNGEYPYGMSDYYTDLDLGENDEIAPSQIVYGGVEFVIDESENAEPSEIIVTGEDEAYHQRRQESIDESQYKEPSGDITVMGSLETDGSNAVLTYFKPLRHSFMYAYNDDTNYLKITRGKAVDYYLIYDPDKGALYTDDGEKLKNFPGAICDDEYLTLTNDFHFETNNEVGLYLRPGTTLEVPEGVTASILSGDDSNNSDSIALMCGGECDLDIDGTLMVSAGSAPELSCGIFGGMDGGEDGVLSISGQGTLYAAGGDIIDTTYASPTSAGIFLMVMGDINVSETTVRAYSGYVSTTSEEDDPDSPKARSVGLDAYDIYVYGGADVRAEGIGSGENTETYGCVAENITSDGGKFSTYTSGDSDCDRSAGLSMRYGGGLRAFNGGTIDCRSTNYDAKEIYGLYSKGIVSIVVDGDESSVAFLGVDSAVNLQDEPVGSYSVKGSLPDGIVTFDKEQAGYVRSDGWLDYVVEFKAAPAVDYGIYYDPESGFRKNTKDGEALDPIPYGIEAYEEEGEDMLILYDAVFKTTYETALTVGEGVTVYVPKNGASVIKTESSANNKIADGIVMLGNNTLYLDGDLSIDVSGSDEENYAIRAEDLIISGRGGLVTSGGADSPSAIYSTGDLTIGEKTYISTGRIKMDDSSETTLTIKDNAIVRVRDDDYSNVGMTVKKLLTEDSAFVTVLKGTITVAGDEEDPGEIRMRGMSSVSVSNRNGTALLGCYDGSDPELNTGNTPIIVEGNSILGCGLIAVGSPAVSHAKAADGTKAVGGDSAMDSYDLQYDDEKFTYINPQTGEAAGNVSFEKGSAPAPSPEATAEPTQTPEVTAEPTQTPEVTAEPTQTPEVTAEPTETPEVTAEPTQTPEVTAEPAAPTATTKPSTGGGGGFKSASSGTASTSKPSATEPAATEAPAATAAPEATAAPAATQQPEPTNAPAADSFPFADVNVSDWFYNAVKAAYDEGLMSGVTDTEFAPNTALTRGMIVTIIGRMGAAETVGGSAFTDVEENAYYAPYIAWASENGIVSGFEDGTFRPDESVTREQTAAILYRYMNYIGADVSAEADILSYTDASDISEYAVQAIQWARGAGVINGYTDGSLAPRSGITRAEFAAMISTVSLI